MRVSDGTSTHYLRSNQLRLYFSSIAYVLLQMLREWDWRERVSKATMLHLRLQSVEDRRTDPHHGTQGVGSLAGGYPYVELFRQVHEKAVRRASIKY